ncbi:MAG: Na(+)/H(+) antiporter subunit D [Pseudomonadota bacterium]
MIDALTAFSSALVATPVMVFLAAAVLVALLPRSPIAAAVTIIAPVVSAWWVWTSLPGTYGLLNYGELELALMRNDKFATLFGYAFSLAAFLIAIYAWHVRDKVQQIATLLYAGSAIGAVFAADLITLFVYWEATALTSVFLIWARRTEGAYATGMRYLIVQIGSGVILVAGIAIHYQATGSIALDGLSGSGPAGWNIGIWLILLAFGVKCAFPLLHTWLKDAYPAATVVGTVTLSAFTTKMAVYCLARAFPGTEMLIYIGAAMTVFPIIFAEIENDLRRVLAYSLNIQLGFMVVGIGVGTELSLNGTAAHAFASVLYKGLLFMTLGAVLFRTGTSKATDLGGLYRTMPYTMICCVIGAASISAFPLFSGFVAKSLVFSATAKESYPYVWAVLVFSSAAVLSHSGIKIPYFTFFAKDSGKRPAEAPPHMLLAMGLIALLCIYIGVFPDHLYALLPHDVEYEPYTSAHILSQLQLLMFAFLAFALLMRFGFFPAEKRVSTLDIDWLYRKVAPAVGHFGVMLTATVWREMARGFRFLVGQGQRAVGQIYGLDGRAAGVLPTGTMVLWLAILLGAALAVNLLEVR